MIFFINIISIAVCIAVNSAALHRKSIFSNFKLLSYILLLIIINLILLFIEELWFDLFEFALYYIANNATSSLNLRIKIVCITLLSCILIISVEQNLNKWFWISKLNRW